MLPCILEAPTLQLTNAKGCYSESLAEYALFACEWAHRLQQLRVCRRVDTCGLPGKSFC